MNVIAIIISVVLLISLILGIFIIPRIKKGVFRMEGGAVPVAPTHVHPHDHKTKNIVIIISMSILMVGGILAFVYMAVGPPAAKKAAVEQASTTADSETTTKVNELIGNLQSKINEIDTKVDKMIDPNTGKFAGIAHHLEHRVAQIAAMVIGNENNDRTTGGLIYDVTFAPEDGGIVRNVKTPKVDWGKGEGTYKIVGGQTRGVVW